MSKCTCCLCGYTWETGTNGSHDCATILRADRDKLQLAANSLALELEELREDKARLERSVASAWQDMVRIGAALGIDENDLSPDAIMEALKR